MAPSIVVEVEHDLLEARRVSLPTSFSTETMTSSIATRWYRSFQCRVGRQRDRQAHSLRVREFRAEGGRPAL